MTDKKVCPQTLRAETISSGRVITIGSPCIKGDCMAWVEPCPPDKCSECVYSEIDPDTSDCIGKSGYCELIKGEEYP